ncbi:MAG: alpha/beta fold hydrolase [Rhodospirillaceae bacterium]|nr:alpha/beta fold hydrolase [Rhodospirillaceae bacterium]
MTTVNQARTAHGVKTIRRQFVNGRYGQMHVRVARPTAAAAGEPAKVPIYCIHQSPSSSLVFEKVMADLGRDRVIAAGDSPGFGESDPPTRPPDIDAYASAHGDVIDALSLGPQIDLFGYFTGAKIAVALALQRPAQIRRIVLNGCVIYTPEELSGERRTYARDQYDWDAGHLLKWWNHLKARVPAGYPLDLFVRHFAEIQRGGPDSWWGHRAAQDYDLATALTRLPQPTLVMCSNDPEGEKSKRALAYLKHGSVVALPHVGQGMLDLHATDVCALMRDFLDHP